MPDDAFPSEVNHWILQGPILWAQRWAQMGGFMNVGAVPPPYPGTPAPGPHDPPLMSPAEVRDRVATARTR